MSDYFLNRFLAERGFKQPEDKEYSIKPPFMVTSHNVYRDDLLWKKIMRGKTEQYFYLRSWIIRGKMNYNDNLNLYRDYFKKGRLAASKSLNELADDLHIGKRTVMSNNYDMMTNGIIDIETIKPEDSYDKKPHCVYIFGEHNMKEKPDYEERYYLDNIL